MYIYTYIYIKFSPSLLTPVPAAWSISMLALAASRAASILPCSCILHQQYKHPASPKPLLQQLPHKLLHNCSLLPILLLQPKRSWLLLSSWFFSLPLHPQPLTEEPSALTHPGLPSLS